MPIAIRIGIPFRDFWDLTPRIIEMYLGDYNEKTTFDFKKMDYNAWLIGSYIGCAIGALLSKEQKYPENPLLNDGGQQEENTEVDAIRFGEWASAFNDAMNRRCD